MARRSYRLVFFFLFLTLFSAVVSLNAANGLELKLAYEIIHSPSIDTSHAIPIQDFTIEAVNLKLHLDTGIIYLFKQITIDSVNICPGGFFIGRGRFEYCPPVSMERDQLRRFFDTDSLNRTFEEAELFFDDDYLQLILEESPGVPVRNHGDVNNAIDRSHNRLAKYNNYFYDFQTLKNLVEDWPYPYLMVNVDLDKSGQVLYRLDPTEREEVQLYKHYWEPVTQFFERVCSYHSQLKDDYNNINGTVKVNVKCLHYEIDAFINDRGKYIGRTDLICQVIRPGSQLLVMTLHPELHVDSILDTAENSIDFLRHKKDPNENEKFYELYLFLNRSLSEGENIKLSFFYEGEIAERNLGEFYVSAGADWYPRFGYEKRFTFDMTFKTPKFFDFTATGKKTEEKLLDDTLLTRWKVEKPTTNVSFNIGNMKKFDFVQENTPPVEVHFSEDMHRNIASYLATELVPIGKNMEKQVAEDVINSIRLFSHFFGEYSYEKMVVTEVLARHGEAFPGFLHLGYSTWVNSDPWGWDRLFRAHEVAHQWWGTTVGFETYHDQWMSEGFAEYSALMYLQAVSGSDKFLEKLQQNRDDIFSVRKFLFSSGEESGPIALGYRTSSTKTGGDYDLIIYKKGALVLHMLRNLLIDLKTMNEDLFFQMMKEYYDTYKGKDATTKDFQGLTEQYTGIEMDWFFNQFVYGTELPEYEFKYVLDKASDGLYYANCTITQSNVSESFKMYVPVEIEFPNGKAYLRLLIDKPLYEFKLPPLAEKPKKIRLNPFESVLAKVKQ